jgi:hypothetical protein
MVVDEPTGATDAGEDEAGTHVQQVLVHLEGVSG